MATAEVIKTKSYQGLDTIWGVEIANKVIPHARILSVSDLQQQLDYPNLNEFTVGTVTLTISDPDAELSPHNSENYFVINDRQQSGYRTPITVKAGFNENGVEHLTPLFIGEVTQLEYNENQGETTIQAIDRTQELRNKNITNFGLTKTFSLEPHDSRTNGNYPIPPAIREISKHSITRLHSPDASPHISEDRTFTLYPGVGDPPFIGPNSPYLYEKEKLETGGDLRESNFYEVTPNSIRIERGELESNLTVTGKVPYRFKRVDESVKQLLRHVDIADYEIGGVSKYKHQKFHYEQGDNIPDGFVSLTDKFLGQLTDGPERVDFGDGFFLYQNKKGDFYYNPSENVFYAYDGITWYNDKTYLLSIQDAPVSSDGVFDLSSIHAQRRDIVDNILNMQGFHIVRRISEDENTLDQFAITDAIEIELDFVKDEDERQFVTSQDYINIYAKQTTSGLEIHAATSLTNNNRDFDVKDSNINVPPILLPPDQEHLASRGRVGYEFENYEEKEIGDAWHWTGFVTDFVYEPPSQLKGHKGKYYFLYSAPLDKISEVDDIDHPNHNIVPKLVEHDVETDSYKVLYRWGVEEPSFSDTIENGIFTRTTNSQRFERGEFWALAHNNDFTEFFILATRSRSTNDNVPTNASYDSLQINLNDHGRVVILKCFKNADNNYIAKDFITSDSSKTERFHTFRPQLAHFYGFATIDGEGTPLFDEKRRLLPDNRRGFFVVDDYLYYPFVQRSGKFGYARISINNNIDSSLNSSDVLLVVAEQIDGGFNHAAFDLTFDRRNSNVFYFGFIHQERLDNEPDINVYGVSVEPKSRSTLKVVKGMFVGSSDTI